MSLVWQCDRCGAISKCGYVDDPPEGWWHIYRPVRGSEGARSAENAYICEACDDDLYDWWQGGEG